MAGAWQGGTVVSVTRSFVRCGIHLVAASGSALRRTTVALAHVRTRALPLAVARAQTSAHGPVLQLASC